LPRPRPASIIPPLGCLVSPRLTRRSHPDCRAISARVAVFGSSRQSDQVRAWLSRVVDRGRNRGISEEVAARHQATLGVRTIPKHRATPVRRGTHVVVAHYAGQQDHRVATEDRPTAADPASSRLARYVGGRETAFYFLQLYGLPSGPFGFGQ
jgi:hypothetical protein